MKKIHWSRLLFITGYHLFLCIALPIYFMQHTPSLGLILTTLALVFISGLAITAGYHRCYSHNAYKIHPVIEAILLFFGSIATQGSAFRWVHDHRLHHAHVDTDQDPYSVKKGLFHAHVLWMFHRGREINPKVISDLYRKKLLVFQHKYYELCMLVCSTLTFLAVGWCVKDYWGAFLFAWWVRLFLLHHTTWCINSLAHYWGTQNYAEEHSAVDNYLISLLTYGEGYHNYHHTFAQDYRNGIRWYHFDPTKWLIWILYKLGLAYDLKQTNNYRIARHLLLRHKEELLRKCNVMPYIQKISEVADRLSEKLAELQTRLDPEQLRALKKSIKEDFRHWRQIVRESRQHQPT